MNRHVRGAGVPNNVGQRFLENPEERCRQIWCQHGFVQIRMHVAFDSRAGLKFICLPFQCRNQPEVIENPWPKFRRNASNGLNGRVDVS